MTTVHPDWFDGVPDWRDDHQAWNAIALTPPTGDQRQLHRAARHHNWQNASGPVQSWTQQAHDDNRATCQKNFWTQALSPSSNAPRVLVTHKKLSFMPDVLKDKITHKLEDTAHLLECLRDWHTQERERCPEKPLWLGNKDQLDERHSWRAETLHDLLADLGLWHFGSVPANVDGAVLRLVYEVDDQVPLFKPDWRHAYPNFY